MPAFDTPDDAAGHFAQAFQATASCICEAPFNYPIAKPVGRPQAIVLAGGADVPLGNGLYLFAGHWYAVIRVERGYAVTTGAYTYKVESDDHHGELFCWHWHPEGTSWCKWPHVHVRDPHFGDHIPTSRVAFEQVVRWLIVEADVPCLRDDWEEVLDRNQQDWLERRNWA